MTYKVVLAIIVVFPLLFLWLAGRLVWVALRTGRLLARGVIYDRAEQPGRYYFGVIFWLLLFGLLAYISILVLSLIHI